MLSIFQNFQKIIQDHPFVCQNESLDEVFQSFSYHLIIGDNQISNISSLYQQNEIIFISEYIDCKQNYIIKENLFFLCIEKNLFIIEQSKIRQFLFFFERNSLATIYAATKNVRNKINQSLNLPLRFADSKEMKYIDEEIENFSNEINIIINTKNADNNKNQMFKFIQLIIKNISGFLIQKSYYKSKIFDRVHHSKEYFSSNNEIEEINQNLYIKLRLLDPKYRNIYLVYHKKRKELLILKLFIDENAGNLFKCECDNYQKIHYPLFPKYFGYTEYLSHKGIIIEYINGITLNRINEMKFNNEIKLKIVFQIMIAIFYLQKNGFIHINLKFDDILINKKGSVVLVDFDTMVYDSKFAKNPKDFTSNKSSIFWLGKIINFIFSEEFSISTSNKYSLLKETCKACMMEDESKRPNIIQLIDNFYSTFFSKITVANEYELIHEILYKEKELFNLNNILYYISEYDHIYALSLLESFNYLIKNNKFIQYLIKLANLNLIDSQYKLGLFYINNQFIPRDVNKSIHYLKLAADQNHVDAQFCLGLMFYSGEFIQRNMNISIKYFTFAADKNHAFAQFYLGSIYLTGEYVPQNINKSICYLTKAANQNISKAQLLLGDIYFNDNNIEKSIHYYKLAAQNNDPVAQAHLGIIYISEKYFPLDINKSIHYFKLASNQNYSYAQFALGKIFSTPKYHLIDLKKAFYYYELASNNNNLAAQYFLGSFYFLNQKLHPQYITKAVHYLTLAANQKHSNAEFLLGCINFYEDLGYTDKDINKAIYYFTLAAYSNHSNAQRHLGLIYYEKKYCHQDINKAIYYLTLSAENNNSEAQCNLGFIYYKSSFIPHDIDKAIYYLTLSAKNNNSNAQCILGFIYYTSNLIPHDINKTIYYLTLAANNNNTNALFNLGMVYLNNKYIPRDVDKAIKYLTQAANLDDDQAQFNLGNLYNEGVHISRDIKKAIYYYTLSASHGLPNAQHALGIKYFLGEYYKKDINKAVYYFKLAANQNYSKSQYNIGLIYAFDRMFKKYRKEAVDYFIRASKNDFIDASYILGCFYLRGFDGIHRDIENAIHYFKKGSSFNHQYSKNNLGVIYAKVKQNSIAIEYFNEAIRQKDDVLSMYNLSQMYLYGFFDNYDIEKAIDLLIKSSNKGFLQSKILLSIALIKKISPINIKNIRTEIEQYRNINQFLIDEICEIIQTHRLLIDSIYKKLYLEYSEKYFIYNFFNKIEEYSSFMNYEEQQSFIEEENKEDQKKKNLDKNFYDGFGEDILKSLL